MQEQDRSANKSVEVYRIGRLLSRSLQHKTTNKVAFPHPKSGKGKDRKEDEPNRWSVVRNLFKRTINVTDYRNSKDQVNPAKDRALGNFTNHSIPFLSEFAACIFQPVTPESWIV